MLTGSLPIVSSHGKWAAFFGGEQIQASLGEGNFWRSQVVVAAISAILHISLLGAQMEKATAQNVHVHENSCV